MDAAAAWGWSPGRDLLANEAQLVGELLADNHVTDSNIKNNLIIDAVLGGAIFLLFCLLQRSSILFRFRLVSPSVSHKPPPLPNYGFHSIWGWLPRTIKTSDLELLQSCGLDALMMVKASAVGLQLCLPLLVVGLVVLMPLHNQGRWLEKTTDQNIGNFMKFTISNIPPRSAMLWLHFALVYVYIGYACWLLNWHYRQWLTIRQHFLKKGEDPNLWRALYEPDAAGPPREGASQQGSGKLSAVMRHIPLMHALAKNQVVVPDDDPQERLFAEEPGQAHSEELTRMLYSPSSLPEAHRALGRSASMAVPRPHSLELARVQSTVYRRPTVDNLPSTSTVGPLPALRHYGSMRLPRNVGSLISPGAAAAAVAAARSSGDRARDWHTDRGPGAVPQEGGEEGEGELPPRRGLVRENHTDRLLPLGGERSDSRQLYAPSLVERRKNAEQLRLLIDQELDAPVMLSPSRGHGRSRGGAAGPSRAAREVRGSMVNSPDAKPHATASAGSPGAGAAASALAALASAGARLSAPAAADEWPPANGRKSPDASPEPAARAAPPPFMSPFATPAKEAAGRTDKAGHAAGDAKGTGPDARQACAAKPPWPESTDPRRTDIPAQAMPGPTQSTAVTPIPFLAGPPASARETAEVRLEIKAADGVPSKGEDPKQRGSDDSESSPGGDDVLKGMPRWWSTVQVKHHRHTTSLGAASGLSGLSSQGPHHQHSKSYGFTHSSSGGNLSQLLEKGGFGVSDPAPGSSAARPGLNQTGSGRGSLRHSGSTPNITITLQAGTAPDAAHTSKGGNSVQPGATEEEEQGEAEDAAGSDSLQIVGGMERSAPSQPTMQRAVSMAIEEGVEQGVMGQLDLLACPSVRYRKTINTYDYRGNTVAVNAQQYVVLVTDVTQPLYGAELTNTQRVKRTGWAAYALWPWNWGHTMDYAERAKVVLPAPNPLSRGSQSTHSPTAVSPSGISGAIGGQPWASGTERRSMPCRSTDRMTANMRSSAPVGLGRPGTGAAARMVSPFHNGPLRLSRSIGGSGRRAAGQGQDDPHDPEVRLLGPGPVAEGIELEPLESHFKVQVSHGGARAEPGSAQEAFLSRRTTGNSPQSSRDHSLQGTGPGAERASPPPGLRNLNSRAMQLHAMPTIGSAVLSQHLLHNNSSGSSSSAVAGTSGQSTGSQQQGQQVGTPGPSRRQTTLSHNMSLAEGSEADDGCGSVVVRSSVSGSVRSPAWAFELHSPSNPGPGDAAEANKQPHGEIGFTSSRWPAEAGAHRDGGSGSGSGQESGSKWDIVRHHVWSGAVAALVYSKRYSVVTATFKRFFPDDFDRAVPVIKHKEVDLLLMKLDEELGAYEQAKLYLRKRGKRLTKRLGFLGLCGRKVDALEHHKAKLLEVQAQVVEARKRALDHGATPSWFVFFKSQIAATTAATATLHAEDNRQFRVHSAPGPEEVNWQALWLTWQQRDLRAFLTRPLMALLILIPVGIFAGGLQQLDYLFCPTHKCYVQLEQAGTGQAMPNSYLGNSTYLVRNSTDCMMVNGTIISSVSTDFEWGWYCNREDVLSQALGFFVVGWLPAILLIVWQGGILPLCILLLVQMSGRCRSLSELDRRIATYMWAFALFNVFLGGMAGSAIVQQVNQSFKKGPGELFTLIGTSLPTSSNFFVNILLFRVFVGIPGRLLIPHVGVRLFLVRRYLRCVQLLTERDRALLYAPVSPRYGFEYGMLSVVFLMALAFALVSPMVLPLASLFFMFSWLFWRYSLLYVYVRKYESGGLMWPFVARRVVLCLGVMAGFTACVFVVKEAYSQALIIFSTVPVILYRFSRYCWYRYQKGVDSVPLEFAHAAPRASVDTWVYIPPPLHPQALGWNPDWGKPWAGWGMPPGYATL